MSFQYFIDDVQCDMTRCHVTASIVDARGTKLANVRSNTPKPHKPNHWTFDCEPGFTLASDEMPESFKLEVQARIFAAIDLMLPPPDKRIEEVRKLQAQPH